MATHPLLLFLVTSMGRMGRNAQDEELRQFVDDLSVKDISIELKVLASHPDLSTG